MRLLAVACSLALAAFVGEVGLRFTRIGTGGYIGRPDPWTGSAYRPNGQAVHGSEGFSVVRINSLGLRDHQTTLAKPAGVLRIAMLGDSYVEAAQLALDDSVSKVLQRALAATGRYEVLNFGVSGYGTAQEYLQLREFGLKFDPDLVVLCVTSGNDIRNNSEALNGTPLLPYFTLDEHGRLVFDASFRDEPAFQAAVRRSQSPFRNAIGWLWGRSRLIGLALTVWRGPKEAPAVPRDPHSPNEPVDPAFNGDWMIYDPDPPPAWKDAWAVTDQLIVATAELCRSRNVAFAVVLVTNTPQVTDESRRYFAEKYPRLDLDYPHRRLSALCDAHGIPCLDLVAPFLDHHRKTGRLLHGFGARLGQGHWNEEGHRLAGELIARFLAEAGLLTP